MTHTKHLLSAWDNHYQNTVGLSLESVCSLPNRSGVPLLLYSLRSRHKKWLQKSSDVVKCTQRNDRKVCFVLELILCILFIIFLPYYNYVACSHALANTVDPRLSEPCGQQ